MNDKQREYLIKNVRETFEVERKLIEAKRVKKPSLNNYLIAAFLDNSIEFADIEKLKAKMREDVIKMPSDAKLIEVKSKNGWSNDEVEGDQVKIRVDLIFKIPEAYKKEYDLWEKSNSKIDKDLRDLAAQLKTIEIKINLGSSKQLDSLIDEADNLGQLSLIKSKLMLSQ